MTALNFDTIALHGGYTPDAEAHATSVPIYQTTSYVYDSAEDAAEQFALDKPGQLYTRFTNPTTEVLEKRLAELEGGVGAVAVASGMAAINYALENITVAGDHLAAVKAAIQPNSKALYIELIGNPNSNIADLSALAEVAHVAGIPLIVDNTFATAYLNRVFDFGADIVVYSATKFLSGHGAALGGIVVDSGHFDWTQNDKFPGLTEPDESYHGLVYTEKFGDAAYVNRIRYNLLRDSGATLSPFNAWLILLGLETLSLRVQRHVDNAQKIAEFLAQHPAVAWVNYAGLSDSPYYELAQTYLPKGPGSIFTFGVVGGASAGRKVLDSVQVFTHFASSGEGKSSILHPASTSHAQLSPAELLASGTRPETLRLSVGIEDVADLIADLDQALQLAVTES
ncbi:O-acetylhomoserine aminocarboxypropyltransferase/cysteine synthase [Weissella cibaria]|uniref:O-acetylhomoserine aminocarboxypropyltransferase/cysteine synthase family protein n=1 Tax=Weissella cibaria TaxID=137591 RepID=UPI001C1FFB69|nr:O-acetylhomoserine aminocarboxypropyltransferase/cysteine synthase family protein [Weissella cibaria]MBU7561103.1 O-acetylhomoserine aminocarboxypropyltransferase/cysteine synthase [Weissella cibaria]